MSNHTVQLAYVGVLVPNTLEFQTSAFSRAGQMYQEELLRALKRGGLSPSIVLSLRPVPTFPRSQKIWERGGITYLPDDIRVTLLPFLNITPIKQLVIGVAVLFSLVTWAWHVRGKGPRVVYTFNLTVPPGFFTLLAARMIGARAVVSLNDVDVPGQTVSSGLLHRFDFWLQHWLIPRFDGHIAVADATMKDFAPGRKYIRLEGGISPVILDSTGEHRRLVKPKNTPFVIVAAGSLHELNGISILLQAFSLLSSENFRLLIAGKGPLQEHVKTAAAADPRIEYLGFIPFEEVLKLYNLADVLINMRLTKAIDTKYFFPSKMMEYLASGTPVITTCAGHIQEEFEGFCYLLKDETVEGLAHVIKQVAKLSEQERGEVGKRARAFMIDEKTWDAQGRKLVTYLMNLAEIPLTKE